MLDRLGNELKIGDMCVCFSNMRTGSSTTRLVQFEGKVIGFTKCLVKVECVKCDYPNYINIEIKCISDYVFKMPKEVSNERFTR